MDDDAEPSRHGRVAEAPGPLWRRRAVIVCGLLALAAVLAAEAGQPGKVDGGAVAESSGPAAEGGRGFHVNADRSRFGETASFPAGRLTPTLLAVVAALLGFSAFFSGSETAFFSIHRLRLRSMAEEKSVLARQVAHMMQNPGRLLTTILVGNMIVNVLIGVLLGTRLEGLMRFRMGSEVWAYVAAVAVCTSVLVMFGEILPKVFAVSIGERFARVAVLPLRAIDKALGPIRGGLLRLTNALFRVTRFHELRAAPFITDEELRAVLHEGEVHGVLEEEERQMIQGILELQDVRLREILVPRPDVVALPEDATVRDALEALREHEFSRMPVYRDSLDTVVGILVAKDLIGSFVKGELDRAVKTLMRPPYFVPETMTVQQFVNDARRHRAHMAVVVDEYGGTEGIVTLEDAMEEVVGDIPDEGDQLRPPYEQISEGVFRVEGRCSLEDLSGLLRVPLEDQEHETLAGFLMDQAEKVPEPGDVIEHGGIRFTVEACAGKRALTVRVQLPPQDRTENKEEGGL